MAESTRSLTDFFSLFGARRAEPPAAVESPVANVADTAYPTKALQKFVNGLQGSDNPLLLDLGPVVGSNVTFFGEQLGCRLRVEDLATDIDRHVKSNTLEELPSFLTKRFTQPAGSVDGILAWDVLDFLDRPAAQALATALSTLLKPDGCLLGFFSTATTNENSYTKYVVVDESTLKYRSYPAPRARQRTLLNGDIIRLFKDLRVTDSFLMKSKVREMLFRKPSRLR